MPSFLTLHDTENWFPDHHTIPCIYVASNHTYVVVTLRFIALFIAFFPLTVLGYNSAVARPHLFDKYLCTCPISAGESTRFRIITSATFPSNPSHAAVLVARLPSAICAVVKLDAANHTQLFVITSFTHTYRYHNDALVKSHIQKFIRRVLSA